MVIPWDESGSMVGDPPKVDWKEAMAKFLADREFRRNSHRFLTRGARSYRHFPVMDDSSGRMSGTDIRAAIEALKKLPAQDIFIFITDGEKVPEGYVVLSDGEKSK